MAEQNLGELGRGIIHIRTAEDKNMESNDHPNS